MKIAEIDKNFLTGTIGDENVVYLDASSPLFRLYGLIKTRTGYVRIPENVASNTSEGVVSLNGQTTSGRSRFHTKSQKIYLKAKTSAGYMPHKPSSGTIGFDVLAEPVESEFDKIRALLPSWGGVNGDVEASADFGSKKMRTLTICFPLYSEVYDLKIGFDKDAEVTLAPDYKYETPVVFYGSSITQGGCVDKPSGAYENILSNWLGFNYINLGFSGNAKGERAMAEYIAGLKMSVFVLDYDHNASSPEHLAATHENFFRIVREAQPDLPIVMTSLPNFWNSESDVKRRDVVKATYDNAVKNGDKNVYFIDGETFFSGYDRKYCTVDCTHPNSLGMYLMAEKYRPVLEKILNN
ncbi:MAG: SGNH/GDSL hydrolase family protein [Clostridia bacterium]|nr:SGNH/GDSL hydrolase family protein [Clostridia bacterium]